LDPASTPVPRGHRANGRLVQDSAGGLYQLHGVQGLVRLSDAQVVVGPQVFEFDGKDVHIGVTGAVGGAPIGVPLLDAAFDPNDPAIVYVVPVLVAPPVGETYKAVAKLHLSETPDSCTLERLYGAAPYRGDGCCNTTPCSSSECNRNRLREIEVDEYGFLYVTSAHGTSRNNWLLIFDAVTSEMRAVLLDIYDLDPPPDSPIALEISAAGDRLYLASSRDDVDPNQTWLFGFTINRDYALPRLLEPEVIEMHNMRQITAITENPADGSLWVAGFTAPTFGENHSFSDMGPIFTTPTLAVVPQGALSAVATDIMCHDLALPLSLAFNAVCQAWCDIEPDDDVDLADFAAFQKCFTGDGVDMDTPDCAVFDSDCDGDLDLGDYTRVMELLAGP